MNFRVTKNLFNDLAQALKRLEKEEIKTKNRDLVIVRDTIHRRGRCNKLFASVSPSFGFPTNSNRNSVAEICEEKLANSSRVLYIKWKLILVSLATQTTLHNNF